jgi:hypothetical protein
MEGEMLRQLRPTRRKSDSTDTTTPKETTMNTANTFLRDMTCGAAATLITLMFTMSFLSATAEPYGAHAHKTSIALQTQPGWFGQPEPAVLVD